MQSKVETNSFNFRVSYSLSFLGFREVFFCSTFETIHLFQSCLFAYTKRGGKGGSERSVSKKSELELKRTDDDEFCVRVRARVKGGVKLHFLLHPSCVLCIKK